MDRRSKPPEWRAEQTPEGRWVLSQKIGGIWAPLGSPHAAFSEEDAKLLALAPMLLVQLVGQDLMMNNLRLTMTKSTSMRHIRDAATDAALQAFIDDVRKTIADAGGPNGR